MDLYFCAVASGLFCGIMLGCATAAATWLVSLLWDFIAEDE